ncbi:hypothetical protein LUZ62_087724 [Rhynchospora pubera]|uniref:Uncharacterized protein n=1 Tax=Rhynchospora pubera TaxID=906938 RepID=A0AAV8CCW2_9POAL|nr:hypothetical protein LUZ62_087724 [Rhynchospora pubera]
MEKASSTVLFVLIVAILCAVASASFRLPWEEKLQAPPPPGGRPGKPVRMVRCRHSEFPKCFMVSRSCPRECPSTCAMDCSLCKPVCNCFRPGAVCDDPRFIGGDGITFYFHGRRDRDFCLVSDLSLHINAHFIGKPHPGKKRDFTWVQSLSILLPSSDPGPHSLYLGAMKTATWDDSVDRLALWYDSNPISLPTKEDAMWHSPDSLISIKRTRSTNGVIVESKNKFLISATARPITKEESNIHHYNITDDDCFAHLDTSFKFYDLSEGVDGILGRTYRKDYISKVNLTNPMPVVGGEHDFITSGLFAIDCAVSRFNKGTGLVSAENANQKSKEYNKVVCQSSPAGTGVLCSR